MIPSERKLKEAFGDDKGRRIRRILDGRDEPESYQSVAKWIGDCYNRPADVELQMAAVDEILGGYGVEAVWCDESNIEPHASYVNLGDTYSTTIIHKSCAAGRTDRFVIGSWGDVVERSRCHFA